MTSIQTISRPKPFAIAEVEGQAQPYGYREVVKVHATEDDFDRAAAAYEALRKQMPGRRLALLEGKTPIRKSWPPHDNV